MTKIKRRLRDTYIGREIKVKYPLTTQKIFSTKNSIELSYASYLNTFNRFRIPDGGIRVTIGVPLYFIYIFQHVLRNFPDDFDDMWTYESVLPGEAEYMDVILFKITSSEIYALTNSIENSTHIDDPKHLREEFHHMILETDFEGVYSRNSSYEDE